LLVPTLIVAQKLRFDHYSLNDGLSQSTIASMIQDRQGFLWIGTEDGLNRFDGYTFKIYQKDPQDSLRSIGGNFVWDLYEAHDGKIWIAHEGGITSFDPVTDAFDALRIGDGSAIVRSIHPKDSTGLWLGTSGHGLFYFDIASKKLTSFINDRKENLKYNTILDIAHYDNGDLLIGTRGGGLFLFNPEKKFYRPPLAQDSLLLRANDIWKIQRHGDQYWLGTLQGLIALDDALNFKMHYPLSRDDQATQRVSTFLFNDDGTLWVACYGGGLVHVDPATAVYNFYTHDPLDPASLANNLVFSLLKDRSDNLWVGTWVAGISKLRKGHDNFSNYSNYDIGTPSNFITSVIALPCDGQENLLVGAYGGGIRMSPLDKTGQALSFSKYILPGNIARAVDPVNCFHRGAAMLWVGSDVDGLVGIPLKNNGCIQENGSIIHYKAGASGSALSHSTVKSVVEDDEGNLWAGTIGGGLNKIIASKKYGEPGSVTHYASEENNPSSLSHNRVNHVYRDRDNNIWVATSNGLDLLRQDRFEHFLQGKIITILQHSQGPLFVGTEEGLFKSDGTNGRFNFVPVAPLEGQLVNAVQEDKHGKLWVATNKGMFWYDLKINTAMQFRSSDGLQGDEYNFNAAAKSQQGLLGFGGVNGLTIFDPGRVVLNTTPPPVLMTGLKIANREVEAGAGNQDVSRQTINYTQALAFRHHQNYLTFEFSALDFTNPSKNRYAYKLEGLDDNWIYSSARNRSVTYTNLDPGTYVLRVKASNNDGTWNEEGTATTIVIHPPWWKTTGAYAFYILIALLLLWLARRSIIQRERLKNQLQLESVEVKKLKELDDFKSKFFANISHEFRTPLSLILGPTEKLLSEGNGKNKNDLITIQNNGRSLLTLVNQMLDLSRIEAGSMRLQVKDTDLSHYLKLFAEGFHSLARQKDIGFSVELSPERIKGYCDPSFLEKIVNNLLSNAIKYTLAGGEVAFTGMQQDGLLTIRVSDTGIGIPPEQLNRIFDRFYRVHDTTSVEGTGLGLALTKELVKIHKGEITVNSTADKGSVFSVTLPILRSMYRATEICQEAQEQFVPDTMPRTSAVSAEEQPLNERDSHKPLLLIVEDNDELREFIRSTLTSHYRILEAGDGDTGLKLAIDEIPDVIVTDWMMPKMDGLLFCRHIKTTEATEHIPVILLTAKAGADSRIEGLVTGADDYLTKPFDLRELKVRIANLIEQRKKLQAKYMQNPLYRPVKAESADERFLRKLQGVIEANMYNSKFGVEEMAREIGMSRVQLYRKLTALTNHTAVEFLRNYRLERAADLLRQGAGNVSEIAFQVGFDNPSYFSKTFREHFGKLPSEVVKT
jgi:signal transduction histidine kinase/ligand-binding sensor domain-containing protein/DNA-binding response OmpR family regulator